MAVMLRPPVAVPARPPRAVSRIKPIRKIGLLGSHTASLTDCPWDDPSWELWGHASSKAWYQREPDRYFDLHPPSRWKVHHGKKFRKYPDWLAMNTVPIYMQQHYSEVPASIEYPKRRILNEFGDPAPYFTNHIAWMIALALTEGITHLGLWGITYAAESEYAIQRGCAEYWLGRAAGMGVKVVLPDQCTLLREPARLYGYESHNENGELVSEFIEKRYKRSQTITPVKPGEKIDRPLPPKEIATQIINEEEALHRPEWALAPEDGFNIRDAAIRVIKGEAN